MKNRQFLTLIWLILIISCFFYQRFHHLEIDHEIIINNIATIDNHVLNNTEDIDDIQDRLDKVYIMVWQKLYP